MIAILAPVGLGAAFGWMLHKAGLTHYDRIVNVYRLRDLSVMKFMLAGLLVGAVLIQLAQATGLAAPLPLPLTALGANLVGGVIFGCGMALAGYCPGTIVAEAGEGRLDAWGPGLAGLIAGALGFGLLYPHVMPPLTRAWSAGRVSIASWTGASPWLVLVVFVEVIAIALVAIERVERRRTAQSGGGDSASAR